MALAPLPTATYASRDAIIRYANRYALVGDHLTLLLDLESGDPTVTAQVVARRPGKHVAALDVQYTSPVTGVTATTEITGDIFNNLTNPLVLRVELFR